MTYYVTTIENVFKYLCTQLGMTIVQLGFLTAWLGKILFGHSFAIVTVVLSIFFIVGTAIELVGSHLYNDRQGIIFAEISSNFEHLGKFERKEKEQ